MNTHEEVSRNCESVSHWSSVDSSNVDALHYENSCSPIVESRKVKWKRKRDEDKNSVSPKKFLCSFEYEMPSPNRKEKKQIAVRERATHTFNDSYVKYIKERRNFENVVNNVGATVEVLGVDGPTCFTKRKKRKQDIHNFSENCVKLEHIASPEIKEDSENSIVEISNNEVCTLQNTVSYSLENVASPSKNKVKRQMKIEKSPENITTTPKKSKKMQQHNNASTLVDFGKEPSVLSPSPKKKRMECHSDPNIDICFDQNDEPNLFAVKMECEQSVSALKKKTKQIEYNASTHDDFKNSSLLFLPQSPQKEKKKKLPQVHNELNINMSSIEENVDLDLFTSDRGSPIVPVESTKKSVGRIFSFIQFKAKTNGMAVETNHVHHSTPIPGKRIIQQPTQNETTFIDSKNCSPLSSSSSPNPKRKRKKIPVNVNENGTSKSIVENSDLFAFDRESPHALHVKSRNKSVPRIMSSPSAVSVDGMAVESSFEHTASTLKKKKKKNKMQEQTENNMTPCINVENCSLSSMTVETNHVHHSAPIPGKKIIQHPTQNETTFIDFKNCSPLSSSSSSSSPNRKRKRKKIPVNVNESGTNKSVVENSDLFVFDRESPHALHVKSKNKSVPRITSSPSAVSVDRMTVEMSCEPTASTLKKRKKMQEQTENNVTPYIDLKNLSLSSSDSERKCRQIHTVPCEPDISDKILNFYFTSEDTSLSQTLVTTGTVSGEKVDFNALWYDALLNQSKRGHSKEIFKHININLTHYIPPLHLQNIRPCCAPRREEKEFLRILGWKETPFSKSEDDILIANWEKFSEEHDIEDPSIFLDMRRTSQEMKRKFLQYLGNGLPDRALYQIYQRFNLVGHPKKGLFSKEEDEIILKAMNLKIPEPYSILSQIFKRSRRAVFKRYQMLCASKSDQRDESKLKWDKEHAESLVKTLMSISQASSVHDFKDHVISTDLWREIEKKMGVNFWKLREFWSYQLHTQLFADSPVHVNEVFKKISKWLHKKNYSTEKDIMWNESVCLVSGATPLFMWGMFRRLRRKYKAEKFKTFREFVNTLYENRKTMFRDRKRYLIRYKVNDDFSLSVLSDETD